MLQVLLHRDLLYASFAIRIAACANIEGSVGVTRVDRGGILEKNLGRASMVSSWSFISCLVSKQAASCDAWLHYIFVTTCLEYALTVRTDICHLDRVSRACVKSNGFSIREKKIVVHVFSRTLRVPVIAIALVLQDIWPRVTPPSSSFESRCM